MIKEMSTGPDVNTRSSYMHSVEYPKNLVFVQSDMIKTYKVYLPLKNYNRIGTEQLAQAFADRLNDLCMLIKEGLLDTATALALRDEISHRFNEVFVAVVALEETLDLSETAVSRTILQRAIEYHLYDSLVKSTIIANDLEIFSELMSSTLIGNTCK